MSERVRVIVLLAMTAVILGLVNLQIVDKETIVRHGAKVLIRLAPVDPRSLMQGDYMSLRFAMTNQVAAAADMARINDGVAVVELRDLGEAIFISIYDGQQLADNQHLLRFRKRGESVRRWQSQSAHRRNNGESRSAESALTMNIAGRRIDVTGQP